MTLLELKPITSQILSAVLELDRLCFGGLWTLEGYQRELDSPNSELIGLFSSSASPAPPAPSALLLGMGCLWAILEEAHITILAVHPCYQHQGLGQALLVALLEVACARGLERATLEVRASNQIAISLYQKFGFKVAGRRRHYYQENEDALILWRSGLQHPEFQETLASWQQLVRDRLTAESLDLQSRLPSLLPQGSSSLTVD